MIRLGLESALDLPTPSYRDRISSSHIFFYSSILPWSQHSPWIVGGSRCAHGSATTRNSPFAWQVKAPFADLAALGCIEELHYTLLPGKLTQPFGPHGLQCFRVHLTSLQSDMYVLSGVSPVCVVLGLRRYPSSLELISPTAFEGHDPPRYCTPCQAQRESRNDIPALPQ